MNVIPCAAELQSTLIGICVALGIRLLIGAEHERRKDNSPQRSAAGIHTFAVASLMGTVDLMLTCMLGDRRGAVVDCHHHPDVAGDCLGAANLAAFHGVAFGPGRRRGLALWPGISLLKCQRRAAPSRACIRSVYTHH